MATQHVLKKEQKGILELVLNRPEKKNALTAGMYQFLADALNEAARRDEIRVILLRGHGDAFTAGNDLADFMNWVESKQPLDQLPVLQFIHAVLSFPKPLVVAVHGVAVGIGTTMLFHCDSVLAAPSARFQLPFVRLGLVPEFANSLVFPQVAGHLRASHWLLTGQAFDARVAREMGVVSEICEEEHLVNRAREVAETMATMPPATVRRIKRMLRPEPYLKQLRDVIARETEAFVEALKSPEHREAVQAFFEKRPPDFSQFR